MAARQKGSEVLLPNLGVYFNVPPIAIPDRGLQDCLNVRINEGQLTSFNVGWRRFSTLWKLDSIVKLIDNFFDSTGAQKLMFASIKNLYEWVEANDSILYLTPRYTTGTVSINNGSATLTGAGSPAWLTSGIKPGDKVFIGGPMRGVDTDVPRWLSAGTGAAVTAPSNLLVPYPTIAAADAGNKLVAHVTYVGDVTHAPGTPAGWTLDYTDNVGSAATGRSFFYSRKCLGTESGNVTFTTALGTTRVGGRIYMFRSSQAVVAAAAAAGTSATVADVGVATGADYRLAVNFTTVHNGSAQPGFTGETGGDWTQPTPAFIDGANLGLGINVALMPVSGTVDGGTMAVTSGSWGVRGYALSVPVWYTVLTVDNDTQITLTSTWQEPNIAGAVYVVRRLLTGDENDLWSTELFHNGLPGPADWWIGTNGTDQLVRWNGTDPAAAYVNTGFICKAIIKWYNMMIYGNLNVGGIARRTSIRNSDIGNPFEVVEGIASELVAHDGVDEILVMLTIADNLVIYSIRNVTLAAFVGFPELFAFRTAVSGIGPLAANSVADFGDNHEWLGPDAAYEFDGVTADEVNYHVMREIIRICPATRYNQIIVHFAEETGEIYWIIPRTSDASQLSPELCYSEHYLENVPQDAPTPFTVRELPASATGYFESLDTLTWDQLTTPWTTQNFRWDDRFFLASFPLNLFGKSDGSIQTIGVADSHDGQPFTNFVRFGRRPVVDGKLRGCVRRVYTFGEKLGTAVYDLDVTTSVTDQMGGEMVEGVPLPYDLAHAGKRFVNPFAVGRFFDVKFGTSGVDRGWILQGYDVENVSLGERDAPG